MSRQVWSLIKQSKFFYVKSFRAASAGLIVSLSLNGLLIIGIYFAYTHQPARRFFAANGITQPLELKPRYNPNESAKALLAPDPVINTKQKEIPQ